MVLSKCKSCSTYSHLAHTQLSSESRYIALSKRQISHMPWPFTETEIPMRDLLYVCTLCGQPFPTAISLPYHMRLKHHLECTPPENTTEISMEGTFVRCTQAYYAGVYYKCLNCDEYIMNRALVDAHVRITPSITLSCPALCPDGVKIKPPMWGMTAGPFDSRGKAILCPQCGLTFHSKPSLTKHKYSVHPVKRFVCEVCSFATARKKTLQHHHWAAHVRSPDCPRPFTCEKCGKNFTDKMSLTAHKRIHRPRRQLCHLCPQAFVTKFSLQKHMRSHTGEHPFLCTECGQGFTQKYNLQVHRRIHTGERPYQCQLCDAAFAQKTSLTVHMKKHEKQDAGLKIHNVANTSDWKQWD